MNIELTLEQFKRQKAVDWNRRITWTEISQSTGVSEGTLIRFAKGKSQRVDLGVLDKICEFFGVPAGNPVPFLIYKPQVKESPNAPSQP